MGTITAAAQPAVYRLYDLQSRIAQPDTLYVVNFWATWCKPCVKELPAFDSLQDKSDGKALKVLLVSLDFTEHLETRLIPFLSDKKIRSECVLLDEPDGNTFINAIHPDWSGAIPATLVKKGGFQAFAEGAVSLRDLDSLCVRAEQK